MAKAIIFPRPSAQRGMRFIILFWFVNDSDFVFLLIR